MKFKKYLPDGMQKFKFMKKKKCFWKNPIVLTITIVLSAALLATIVIGLVKWIKKDDDLLDDDWMLDDDDGDLFFNESDFEIEGE